MTAGDDDLNWRIEQACREGWPAATETIVDGWLFRQSGGRIRRTNSANPLRGDRGAPDGVIDAAETFYASHGQTPLFRVPDIANELETALEQRGYQREGERSTSLPGLTTLRRSWTTRSRFRPRRAWTGSRRGFAWAPMTTPIAVSFAR
ncbi:GNAT family N-acetyltransferase, cg3035/Rv0428c family [Mesorhizobium sp. ORM8.1]